MLAHHLLLAEAGDLGGLAVPLVDEPAVVDAEDGRVRSVDDLLHVLGDAAQLGLCLGDLRDVLPHPDDAHDLAGRVEARRGVEQHLDALAHLGEEREDEVVGALALQRLVQHLLHLAPELLGDVLPHEVLPHHLLLAEAGDLGGLAVPLVDVPVGVDAQDGRVRSVDKERQIVRDARQLRLVVRLVLPDAHDAQHSAVDVDAA